MFYAPFLELGLELLARCRDRGHSYYVLKTGGYRTFNEQMKLWLQGRTLPGKRVTNAKGGESCHNYSIAWDVCFDADAFKSGLQPAWGKADYEVLAEEGAKIGLQVGVPGLQDYGHVQLPLASKLQRKEAECLRELKVAHNEGGLKAAWKVLDSWGPWGV